MPTFNSDANLRDAETTLFTPAEQKQFTWLLECMIKNAEQKRQANHRTAQAVARQSNLDRSRDTRRKILVGAVVLKLVGEDAALAQGLKTLLDTHLSERDKLAFPELFEPPS